MLITALLFVGWYLANFLCNTTSKETLKNEPAPIILTFVQMLVGAIGCCIVIWSRKRQGHSQDVFALTSSIVKGHTIRQLAPLVGVHVLGNLCTNFGIMHGSIAFVQIIKATEPIFTILWGVLLMREYPSFIKVVSTLPVVAGVIMVSYGETKITYTLLFSMLSNVAFSFRNVAGKKVMLSSFQDPTILFYGINILGAIALLPVIIISQESSIVFGDTNMWSSGLFHFLYNWCSFLLLARLHVLSHALGNVMKRAFIIIVGVVLYHNDVNIPTILGIIFCIGGSLLYNFVGSALKNNDLSRNLKLFNYTFSIASALSVLILFSSSGPTAATAANYLSPFSPSSTLSSVRNVVVPEPPEHNDHFMIIWTRLEQQIPVRIEKCVESILYHHKNALITVYASYIENQDPLQSLVAEYPFRIQIKPIDVQKLLRDTPLEYWGRNHREWKWRSLNKFDFHVVDALRYALLYKYGGVVIDADMVLLNPITQPYNFISDYFGELTTKVMKFEKEHPFIYYSMEKFATNYEPLEKSAHGPDIVSYMYNTYCKQLPVNATSSTSLAAEICSNVKSLILVNTAHFNVEEYYDFVAFDQAQHLELMDSVKDSVAVDINYFKTANYTVSKDTFIDTLLTKFSVQNFGRDHAKPFNLNLLMKFGTYVYNTINFGDEVQSIANIQYLPRIDYFLERDSPMNYSHLPNITIIANGWYTWNGNWTVPPNIHPIFVAFHGSDRFPYNATKEYMIKMGPIGCRDLFTLEKFRQIGVNAYFSGCITTTLQNTRWDHPKENKIYITDATLKHLLPIAGVPGNQIINKTHVTWSKYRYKYNYKMDLACRTLDLYSVAKLVITTRIHCALPSLAFGTPVIFTKPNKKFFEPLTNGMDPRWPGLLDLFTQFTINTTVEEAKNYPYDNPPKNRNHDWMRKNVWSHLQRSPYIKESGRMFGVFRNVGY